MDGLAQTSTVNRVGRRQLSRAFASLLLLAAWNAADSAMANDWLQSGSSSIYQDVVNWSAGAAPGATDTANFTVPGQYAVDWDSLTGVVNPGVGLLRLQSGAVTFRNTTFLPQSFTVNGSGGSGDIGDFEISGAAWFNSGLQLTVGGGASISSGGSAFIDGSHPAGSAFHVLGTGFDISGTFNVVDGAQASSVNTSIALFSGTSGLARITGAGTSWAARNLHVGSGGSGELFIQDGASVSSQNAFMGTASSSDGSVEISGAGSAWTVSNITNSAMLNIGYTGNAEIEIADGGSLVTDNAIIGNQNGSTGRVSISAGTWKNGNSLVIGQGNSNGTSDSLQIGANGQYTGSGAGSSVVIGVSALSQGEVILDGDSASFDIRGDLVVGDSGSGRFTVNSNGSAEADVVTVGKGSGSVGNVSVTGSQSRLTVGSNLVVGQLGRGSLSVSDSGELSAPSASLGVSAGSNGTVFLNNGASFSVDDALNIGGDGIGGLAAETGSTISASTATVGLLGSMSIVDSTLNVSGGITNSGNVQLSGATQFYGTVSNVGAGVFVNSAGTTTFHGDVTHNGDFLETGSGASTVFNANFSGAGRFNGRGEVVFNAGLQPGNSPGNLEFLGDVTLGSSSQSVFELGGNGDGQFDRLDIAGDLTIGGELQVSLIDGFTLAPEQRFLIADVAGSQTGSWSGLAEGSLVGNFGGTDLFISYSDIVSGGNGITLFTVAIPEPGSLTFLLALAGSAVARRKRRIA